MDMASAKLASLAIRTVAKPIATSIKHQAEQHESFRKVRAVAGGCMEH